MTEQEFKDEIKRIAESQITQTINGHNISNLDLLEILIKQLQDIYSTHNIDDLDFRKQLWGRLNMIVNWYYHNIRLTIENQYDIYMHNCQKLDYIDKFSGVCILTKEVYDRTSFFSRLFFDVEYFLDQVNSKITFEEKNSKTKSHYFQLLLEKIGMDNEEIVFNQVIDDVNKRANKKLLVKNSSNKKLTYAKLFEYVVTLRNCFHNNGFSQKALNNLNIGGIEIKIQTEGQATMGMSVIFIVLFILFEVLDKVVAKLNENNTELWEDRYTKCLIDTKDKETIEEKLHTFHSLG